MKYTFLILSVCLALTLSGYSHSLAQVYERDGMSCIRGVYGSEDCVPIQGGPGNNGRHAPEPVIYDPIPGYAARLENILADITRYSAHVQSYVGMASPSSEWEMNNRIQDAYNTAFELYITALV